MARPIEKTGDGHTSHSDLGLSGFDRCGGLFCAATTGQSGETQSATPRSVDCVFGTVALSRAGVEFKAFDEKPAHVIFLLFHTPDQFAGKQIKPDDPGDIYTAFERISKLLQNDGLLARLRECEAREDVFQSIVNFDD